MLDALSDCDLDAFAELIDPEVEIETERGVKRGAEGALRWAQHRFDHLERRYVLDEIRESGDTVVALARIQYVWRDSGKLGEEWLHGIVLAFRHGKLAKWRVYDDPIDALEALDA